MRRRFVALSVLALALALASAGAALAKSAKPAKPKKVSPEGTWVVKVTPDSASAARGEKEFDDTLTLRKGKFHSSSGDARGFAEAPYRVDGKHWLSDALSKKEGKIHWHGEVSGDSVTGQMTWTRSDGSVVNYTFTGSRSGGQPQTREGGKPRT